MRVYKYKKRLININNFITNFTFIMIKIIYLGLINLVPAIAVNLKG